MRSFYDKWIQSIYFRYLFWSWLFIPVNQIRGDTPTQRMMATAAAYRHNVQKKGHLKTYAKRWTFLSSVMIAFGGLLEKAFLLLSSVFFTVGIYGVAVLAVCGASYLMLSRGH